LNAALYRLQPKIDAILADYGVPRADGDRRAAAAHTEVQEPASGLHHP
jgi:hypothetical protein